MSSLGNHGAAARKHLRVLLPFSCDSLRIPDELAVEIGAGEALVVGPSGGEAKVWPVEVGRDGDGSFLGRGWPEFADACGVGAGWLLVLRHRGRGVLTAKAFDASCCLREPGTPTPAAVEATTSIKEAPRKPQFISVLPQDFMEKMQIPAMFVQHYIPKDHLNNRMAILFGPIGKFCPVELEMNRSEVFFAGGWSQFAACHGITEANALLLRYEGNMVFTVKMFGPEGCQRESKHKDCRTQRISTLTDIEKHQEAPYPSIQKHKSKNYWPSSEGQNKPKGSMTCLKKRSKVNCVYDIGPPAWMKKKINTRMIENHHLSLPCAFCDAIGFREPCTITLQAPMDSTRSWQVHGHPYKNGSCQLGSGWKRFCQDIGLKDGDVCTIKVIETALTDR